ncbi:LolA family protein [Numidum massiliense]|uniref:LolA family protein n=1 Tax=Numidum massiliense TaxID=1522315 RepID=UPI0006D5367B|nr:DUF4367 domain-containing protein [Numidum massiliense]
MKRQTNQASAQEKKSGKVHGFILSLSAFSLIAAGCSMQEANAYSPETIVQKTLEQSKSIDTLYGEADLVTYVNDKKSEQFAIKEWVDFKENKRRTEIDSKDEQVTSVKDGKKIISYTKGDDTAHVIDDPELLSLSEQSPQDSSQTLLQHIKKTHDAELVGEEKVANRDAFHIEAKAKRKNSFGGDMDIWIDKKNWIVLKSISHTGDIRSEMEYKKVEVNKPLEQSLFVLDLPDNVKMKTIDTDDVGEKVTIDEARKLFDKPVMYFPEQDGLKVEKVEKVEATAFEHKELIISYAKEDQPYISLTVLKASDEDKGGASDLGMNTKKVKVRSHEGEFVDEEGFRFLSWEENGMTYSIMLEDPKVTLEELQKLAETMSEL